MSDTEIIAICMTAIVVSFIAFLGVGIAVTHRWPWDGEDAGGEEDDDAE